MLTDEIELVQMYGSTTVKKYNWRNYREPTQRSVYCSLRLFSFGKIELTARRHAEVTYDDTRERKRKREIS